MRATHSNGCARCCCPGLLLHLLPLLAWTTPRAPAPIEGFPHLRSPNSRIKQLQAERVCLSAKFSTLHAIANNTHCRHNGGYQGRRLSSFSLSHSANRGSMSPWRPTMITTMNKKIDRRLSPLLPHRSHARSVCERNRGSSTPPHPSYRPARRASNRGSAYAAVSVRLWWAWWGATAMERVCLEMTGPATEIGTPNNKRRDEPSPSCLS